MPDPLVESINRAIGERVDPMLFEQCAVDLLRESYYPDLRGTPEKRDAGIDGFSGPDAEPEFVLVATTAKDFARNLRESAQRYIEAGGPCRTVVFATTQEVTGERRLRLQQELSQRWGVRLLALHDRGDFVHLLYRNPRWRKGLLGVTGVAKALSRFPANARPTPPIPLIARDDDLQRLRDVSGNLLVVGKPGVGKTFLLERLASEGWCVFDAGWGVDALEDAIREMGPERIVIDDAHLIENRIPELRRLRREIGADFDIVAVTWPGQADVVGGLLEDATQIDIKELERDQVLRIVEEAGVSGPPELQRVIVDQAHGRAGLAVTLAWACVGGHGDKVATGEALLNDLVGWYSRAQGEPSRHLLGVLALAGEHGATMEQARGILALSRPDASNLVRGIAQGGTIDEVPSAPGRPQRLTVQPEALRYALVRDVFFSGPGALDARSAVAALDHPSIAAVPLIGAAHRGADVDRTWLQSVVAWSDPDAAKAYALLGQDEFRVALERAPQRGTHIAGAAYHAGIDPEGALEALMEAAVHDDRSERNSPDHPIGIVANCLAGMGLADRQLAVQTARRWLEQGRDATVAARVFMHAVYPGIESASADPGLGNTIAVRRGVVPQSWVDELSRLWDEALDSAEEYDNFPPAPLLSGLQPWVHPGGLGFGRGPDEETAQAIRAVAHRVIERLANIFGDRPGALRRLRSYAERGALRLDVQIDVPEAFGTLFPDRSPGEKERAEEHLEELAGALIGRSAADVADFIAQAEAEAALAGIRYPRHTPQFARLLAERVDGPEVLFEALLERDAPSDVLLPLIEKAADSQRPGWERAAARALGESHGCEAAMWVALTRPCSERLKMLAVERAPDRLHVVDIVVDRDETDHATLGLLFDAPDVSVQRRAAVMLGTEPSASRLVGLPQPLLDRWRAIIVESRAGDPYDDWDGYWLADILARDGDLCADWLREWFNRLEGEDNERLPNEVKEAVAALPLDVRVTLIREIPGGAPHGRLREITRSLVSENLEAADALFGRSDLETLHEIVLRDGPSASWMERALMALGRGWTPDEIVRATEFSHPVWDGGDGRHWQQKVVEFERLQAEARTLRDSQRELISTAGIAYFEKQRDAEIQSERRRRVLG